MLNRPKKAVGTFRALNLKCALTIPNSRNQKDNLRILAICLIITPLW